MKRAILIATGVLLAAAVGAQYVDAEFARPRIERALQRGLGRRVEVGKVYFNLLTGPGFTVEDVTIYDDPRAGIEPFAHVWQLEARVNLLSLFSRKLEFWSLRLGESTDINLVKTAAGPWNFQYLLSSAPALAGSMPAIKMRAGRVNFKFADTKSVFYLNDADFDVSPSEDGSAEVRIAGAPSRTDQAQQNFGRFFVRGKWDREKLNFRVELEPSALEEVARLLDQRGFGLHGTIAFDAQIAGPTSDLTIDGNLQLGDVRRWGLLPQSAGGWQVGYKGKLDPHNERLTMESTTDPTVSPVTFRFRAWDFLSSPQWDASAGLKQIPLSSLLELIRQAGGALPAKLAAEGSVSGELQYSGGGLSGHASIANASFTLPGEQPIRAETAEIALSGQTLSLEPATIHIGENDTAELEGSYTLPRSFDLKVSTRGFSIADLRAFGLAGIPFLERTSQGTWRGWTRYEFNPSTPGEWSGEYEVQNARVAIEGLTEPLRIQSAAVSSKAARVAVTRLHAKLGDLAFTGEYRYDPVAVRPHKFRIAIPQADASQLEALASPTLVRERGFFARALRLGAAAVPDWLHSRRADGTITVDSFDIAGTKGSLKHARVLWDGTQVRLAAIDLASDDSRLQGDLTIDLAGRAPRYRFDGKLENAAYRGGTLDLEGSLTTDGSGADLVANASAQGSLRGESIEFSPDAEFQKVAGCFELLPGLRWKLSCLEVTQGGETYTGSGATQSDGRLALDLAGRGKQFRYTALTSRNNP
jgi:hypothetical protein